MNASLFETFAPASSKQWKQKIQADLKGADYQQTLVWESLEGISVRPFYHADEGSGHIFTIGSQEPNWHIGESFELQNKDQLPLIDASYAKGTQDIWLKCNHPDLIIDCLKLLQNQKGNLFLKDFNPLDIQSETIEMMNTFALSPLFLNIDPLGHLARTGNWHKGEKEDITCLKNLITKQGDTITTLAIGLDVFQNAGANMVQQLAMGLSQFLEYQRFLGFTTIKLCFVITVGGNYFFEIAKLRTLRWLFESLLNHFGWQGTCHVLACPSTRNKTIYDYNVNLLRTTSECMSAILGGADTIVNLPYDSIYNHPNEFASRIARNQLLILREESYFNKPNKAISGNYYLNYLVGQMAEKAKKSLQKIEKNGGFLSQLKKGQLQKSIQIAAHKEQKLFDDGQLPLLGTNLHPKKDEVMRDFINKKPLDNYQRRKTILTPIVPKRLALENELKRLKDED